MHRNGTSGRLRAGSDAGGDPRPRQKIVSAEHEREPRAMRPLRALARAWKLKLELRSASDGWRLTLTLMLPFPLERARQNVLRRGHRLPLHQIRMGRASAGE
jgi:hypothetical protein